MITGSWTARTVLELTRSLVTRVLVGGIQKAKLSRKLKISDLPLTAATQRKPLFTNTSKMYTYWDTSFYRVSLFPFCSVLSKGRTRVKIKSVLRIRNEEKKFKEKNKKSKNIYLFNRNLNLRLCAWKEKNVYTIRPCEEKSKIIFALFIFCRKPQVGVGEGMLVSVPILRYSSSKPSPCFYFRIFLSLRTKILKYMPCLGQRTKCMPSSFKSIYQQQIYILIIAFVLGEQTNFI